MNHKVRGNNHNTKGEKRTMGHYVIQYNDEAGNNFETEAEGEVVTFPTPPDIAANAFISTTIEIQHVPNSEAPLVTITEHPNNNVGVGNGGGGTD